VSQKYRDIFVFGCSHSAQDLSTRRVVQELTNFICSQEVSGSYISRSTFYSEVNRGLLRLFQADFLDTTSV